MAHFYAHGQAQSNLSTSILRHVIHIIGIGNSGIFKAAFSRLIQIVNGNRATQGGLEFARIGCADFTNSCSTTIGANIGAILSHHANARGHITATIRSGQRNIHIIQRGLGFISHIIPGHTARSINLNGAVLFGRGRRSIASSLSRGIRAATGLFLPCSQNSLLRSTIGIFIIIIIVIVVVGAVACSTSLQLLIFNANAIFALATLSIKLGTTSVLIGIGGFRSCSSAHAAGHGEGINHAIGMGINIHAISANATLASRVIRFQILQPSQGLDIIICDTHGHAHGRTIGIAHVTS